MNTPEDMAAAALANRLPESNMRNADCQSADATYDERAEWAAYCSQDAEPDTYLGMATCFRGPTCRTCRGFAWAAWISITIAVFGIGVLFVIAALR